MDRSLIAEKHAASLQQLAHVLLAERARAVDVVAIEEHLEPLVVRDLDAELVFEQPFRFSLLELTSPALVVLFPDQVDLGKLVLADEGAEQ